MGAKKQVVRSVYVVLPHGERLHIDPSAVKFQDGNLLTDPAGWVQAWSNNEHGPHDRVVTETVMGLDQSGNAVEQEVYGLVPTRYPVFVNLAEVVAISFELEEA